MARPLAAALAAVLVAAPAALGVPSAAAQERTTSRLLLQAQENFDLNEDPTRAAVVFSLKKGDSDPAWDVLAGDAQNDDLAGIGSWQLQLFDSVGDKVSYVQGRGAPPRTIDWYGVDEKGTLLPNGFYTARLAWTDGLRAVHATPTVSTSLLTLDEMRDFLGTSVTLSYVNEGLLIRIVENLLFPLGRTEIQKDSLPSLAKIASFLKSHPHNRLVVAGYTDSQGPKEVNDLLSSKRAQAVYDYLLAAGIDPARASFEGRGSAAPIASNATGEGRAKNRRVEIRLLKTGS